MVTTPEDFKAIRNDLKSKHKKIVFTNGCFDILHRGHAEYLNSAKSLADILVVGVNSDNSVKKIKGKNRPFNNESDRAFILDNLKSVDYVIIFNEDTPYDLIKEIVPDYLVKGGDWKEDDIVGADIVKTNGGKVLSLAYIDNYSTTNIIKKMNQ